MSHPTDDALLEFSRVFDASAEDLFHAWIDREEWQSWIGPEGTQSEVQVLEPRVGGRYRLLMTLTSGQQITVVGIYKAIDPPRTLAFTWGREGGEHDSLVTLRFRPVTAGTELTLRHQGLLTIENRDGHGKGWNSALNKLESRVRKCP